MPSETKPLSPEEVDALRNKLWRIGSKVPLNVYYGNKPMFQCHTPEDALMVVNLLNGDRLIATVRDREQVRDGWVEDASRWSKLFASSEQNNRELRTERDELQRQLAEAQRDFDTIVTLRVGDQGLCDGMCEGCSECVARKAIKRISAHIAQGEVKHRADSERREVTRKGK